VSDLSFDRLPPTIFVPGDTTAAAIDGASDKPTVQSTWFGTLVGGSKAIGYTVHLFADPPGVNIVVGTDITAPAAGTTVQVGFKSDNSVSIVGVP
jgi:hypothetical protein